MLSLDCVIEHTFSPILTIEPTFGRHRNTFDKLLNRNLDLGRALLFFKDFQHRQSILNIRGYIRRNDAAKTSFWFDYDLPTVGTKLPTRLRSVVPTSYIYSVRCFNPNRVHHLLSETTIGL